MNLVAALAANAADTTAALARRNNLTGNPNFYTVEVDEVIPGLPTENWVTNRIGSTGFTMPSVVDFQLPETGTQREMEFHGTIYVPFNTDLESPSTSRDIFTMESFDNGVAARLRYNTDGDLQLTVGSGTTNLQVLEGFRFVPGHVYHMVTRVRGETSASTNDAAVELWINGELMITQTDISLTTSTGGATLQGRPRCIVSGPDTIFLIRDLALFEGGWSTAPGIAPRYFRVEALAPVSVEAENTFTIPGNDPVTLSDNVDDTFSEGDNDGDRLAVKLAPVKSTPTGITESQLVFIRSTKSTTENNEPTVGLHAGDDSISDEDTYLDLTTDSFTDRRFSLNVEFDINDIDLRVTNNEVTA